MLFLLQDGLAYAPRRLGGYDQVCLSHFVWPMAKYRMMQHDSYTCKSFSNTSPFPTKREEGVVGNYVGSIVSLGGMLQSNGTECPVKCRPKNQKDMRMCK